MPTVIRPWIATYQKMWENKKLIQIHSTLYFWLLLYMAYENNLSFTNTTIDPHTYTNWDDICLNSQTLCTTEHAPIKHTTKYKYFTTDWHLRIERTC